MDSKLNLNINVIFVLPEYEADDFLKRAIGSMAVNVYDSNKTAKEEAMRKIATGGKDYSSELNNALDRLYEAGTIADEIIKEVNLAKSEGKRTLFIKTYNDRVCGILDNILFLPYSVLYITKQELASKLKMYTDTLPYFFVAGIKLDGTEECYDEVSTRFRREFVY